jgi:cysteine synthase B
MATISRLSPRSPADVSSEEAAREIAPVPRARGVLDLIGNTPLLEITRLTEGLLRPGVRIFAKLEGFNPGGSVKDRAARKMIEIGLKQGALRPGKVIIDSSSGNTGIALAMIGAALGYPVELVMAANVSRERKKILGAFGARIIYSDPLESSDGAIILCRKVVAADPERYFKPDQYNNEANPLAHFETTGPEIWRQTDGRITHFVASIGTSGTVMGTGRFLKSRNPEVRVIAVEPDDAMHGLEGLKHMASSIVPGIYHESELDGKIPVGTDDAYEMVYALGQIEGILVGQSSGAAMVAALKVALGLREGCVVTVFPDFGDKYLSTNLWIGWRQWRRERLDRLVSKWNEPASATT